MLWLKTDGLSEPCCPFFSDADSGASTGVRWLVTTGYRLGIPMGSLHRYVVTPRVPRPGAPDGSRRCVPVQSEVAQVSRSMPTSSHQKFIPLIQSGVPVSFNVQMGSSCPGLQAQHLFSGGSFSAQRIVNAAGRRHRCSSLQHPRIVPASSASLSARRTPGAKCRGQSARLTGFSAPTPGSGCRQNICSRVPSSRIGFDSPQSLITSSKMPDGTLVAAGSRDFPSAKPCLRHPSPPPAWSSDPPGKSSGPSVRRRSSVRSAAGPQCAKGAAQVPRSRGPYPPSWHLQNSW